MHLEFEPIAPTPGQSFALRHYTHAQDRDIRWHYHPEYELVYLPQGSGRRHVGQHVSRYAGGELLLMGPNLPHLSFSYEQQGAFEQVVVQFREDFLGEQFLQRPELAAVAELLGRSRRGLSFGPATRATVGAALRERFMSWPPRPMPPTCTPIAAFRACKPASSSAWARCTSTSRRTTPSPCRITGRWARALPLH